MPVNQNFRVASIDVLRALTMLLMIFVNDLWSLTNIPLWLEHTAAEADGMGLADIVFPAFLFIVGMSIPLSVQQRRQKGDNTSQIAWHIAQRSIALLVMGLFLVNGEYINETATGMQRVVWNMICCTCFILFWNNWPAKMHKGLRLIIRLIAFVTLAMLAWVYRGGEGEHPGYFATYWWGILGLIGWAYFVSALVYLFSGGNIYVLINSWIIFLFLCCASHAGWIDNSLFQKIMAPIGEGAMPAFTMGGVVTTMTVLHFRQRNKTGKILLLLFALAMFLFIAGIYLRNFWGISKIRATPAWVLICSAITILVFIPVYWIVDVKGKSSWFKLIQPAGTNTLLCYLLPYFAYGLVVLTGLYLPTVLLTGGIGLLKSFVFALLIVIITGLLGKAGLRLKL
jgi:predicted acyltransferase